ncbi:MAG: heme-binding protein [Verrucomicrobiota bacterium]
MSCSSSKEEDYETARYDVLLKEGSLEIRLYDDLYVASAKMGKGLNSSFMKLFGYISRDNRSDTKIAMTTPVFGDMEGEEQRMYFVLPEEYQNGSSEIPEPNSKSVKIDKIKGGQFVAYKYIGSDTKEMREKAKVKLQDWAEAKKRVISKEFLWAAYNGPSVPRDKRHHEILARVVE